MSNILEQLLHSPRLKLYLEKIHDVLVMEQQRREEFYLQISEKDKAEFINGKMILHSPVKLEHNVVTELLIRLMSSFVDLHGLGYVGHEKLMISLSRNDYEPDLCFFQKARAERFESKQMHFPAPDLIVEVLSPTTVDIDRGIKFDDYAAHGVSEYWIVDPETEILEQYLLKDDQYQLAIQSSSGSIKSQAIPGFEIPIRAIFDKTENIKVLKEILK